MNKLLIQLARILMGCFVIVIGLLHFYYNLEMALFVPLPSGASQFVYAVGGITTLCGIFIVLNKQVRLACITFASLLFLTAAMVQGAVEWRNPDFILSRVGLANALKFSIACIVLLVLAIRRK